MRAEGQTDMTVLVVAFRNFSKAPKIYVGFEVYAQKKYFPYISLVSFYQLIELLLNCKQYNAYACLHP